MKLAIATLLLAAALLALIRLVRWRLGHFDAANDDARQIADRDRHPRPSVRPFMLDRDEAERVRDFGDMPRVPFGATPEALTITNEGE